MVPVTVSGTITDTGSGVNANSAAYSVKDEYGEVQPMGAITLGPGGNYSFSILLQASRQGTDLDGRHYTLTVRAEDDAGNGGSEPSRGRQRNRVLRRPADAASDTIRFLLHGTP
jgi:hypothetical protein